MKIRSFCSKVGCGFQDMHLIHICLVKGSELFKCFVLQCDACGKHHNVGIEAGVTIDVGEKL